MSAQTPYLFLINPASGSGKGLKVWKKLEALLQQRQIPYLARFTQQELDGERLTAEALAEGYRSIQVVGGDGHFREVASAVIRFGQTTAEPITLCLFTAGTGNDVVKSFGLPVSAEDTLAAMLQGNHQTVDAGKISCGDGQTHYFTNFGGVGFDSYVVEKTTPLKKLGAIGYLAGTLKELFRYQKAVFKIESEAYSYTGKVLMVIAGNGRYSGGGMLLVPGAQPNDGLLFVTVVRDLHPLQLLYHVRKIFTGNFLNHPRVDSFACRKVKISLSEGGYPLKAQADGDITGPGPWTFEIIPAALNVIVAPKPN